MTRETFNMEYVTQLSTKLEAAPAVTATKMSKAEVLRQLEPMLQKLRTDKGYTLQDLVELLKKHNLSVKVSTLQGALKKKGTGKKREKAVAKVETPPAPPAALQEGMKPGDLDIIASKTPKKKAEKATPVGEAMTPGDRFAL